jgi:RNA polymerase sigma factor (sigma-70 family)
MTSNGTIHIIEPDDTLRGSLQQFLSAMALETRTYARAEDFLAQADAVAPGCVVTEVFLPGVTGLELQQRINGTGESMPIIFVSEYADVDTAVRAVQAGAVGFLTKPFSRHVLLENVRAALERDQLRRQREAERKTAQACIDSLSARERELLDCVMQGMKNREIAERLGLNLKTIEMHRGRMMGKMHADNLVDLIKTYQLAYPALLAEGSAIDRRTRNA